MDGVLTFSDTRDFVLRFSTPCGGGMLGILAFAIVAVAVLGWMLYTNARDRKLLEKELEEVLKDSSDGA
ncbi:hypothetical protein LQ564_14910 [Massilia sp. G4R7]|uniref:Uncharacterized protein n=1 Tax=Massilia phyllostachyos TaxID=2898585 RepID=A0ABS8Q778_9BURK|nr:hypothetical protein [Massilia phyllostachyos]MCD2517602.1 hypothetical protein [Massilia phyllostachyos]